MCTVVQSGITNVWLRAGAESELQRAIALQEEFSLQTYRRGKLLKEFGLPQGTAHSPRFFQSVDFSLLPAPGDSGWRETCTRMVNSRFG